MMRARTFLVAAFVGGLVLQLLVISLTYLKGEISPKDVGVLTAKLLGIYSVQMAVILGGIFGQRGPVAVRAPTLPFRLALTLSVLWNLLLLWRAVAFYFVSDDRTANLMSYWDTASAASSFLVAGALAYFFAAGERRQSRSE